MRHIYPRATSARILTAVGNIAFGLRLLWPDDILSPNPGYRHIETVFRSDLILGLLLLVLGIACAAALLDDRWRKPARAAISAAGLVWTGIAVLIAIANPGQFGTIAYLFIAATHAFAYAHTVEWGNQLDRGVR